MEPTIAFARPRQSSGGLWLIIPIIPGIQRELSNRDGLLAEAVPEFPQLLQRSLDGIWNRGFPTAVKTEMQSQFSFAR